MVPFPNQCLDCTLFFRMCMKLIMQLLLQVLRGLLQRHPGGNAKTPNSTGVKIERQNTGDRSKSRTIKIVKIGGSKSAICKAFC